MTLQEAENLIEQVQREEPRILATMDTGQIRASGDGYRVRLTLKARNLVMVLNQVNAYESVKWAWLDFLPGLKVAVPDWSLKVHHLVDGVPMLIRQSKDGYWYGFYRSNNKTRKKYFGTADPRDRYPIVEHSNERQEVTV